MPIWANISSVIHILQISLHCAAPAHWAVLQGIPAACETDCVAVLANWNWNMPRQFQTDRAGDRGNHLANILLK